VEYIIGDFENEWLYQQNSFDFVHARLLAGKTTSYLLKPTNLILPQMCSRLVPILLPNFQDVSPLLHYLQALDTAERATGRELNIYYKLKEWMIDAGFEDVQQFIYLLPYLPWPRDPYIKEAGKYQAVMAQRAVESYGLRLYTQVLGWGAEPARIFQAMVKKRLNNKHMHACQRVGSGPVSP
jgi:hypothetical protein